MKYHALRRDGTHLQGAMTETREFGRLGPYLLVRSSGTGGMGRVELALPTDVSASEVRVIKRMHTDGRSEDQEARFRREAQIAARLQHENIARTLQVEDIDGELCLAQEFIDGLDLGKVMRQCRPRTLPITVAADIVREVCRGLSYAHDFGGLGIVHRDVTPENIMISFTGAVKIVDFGIARSKIDGTLTNLGVVIGRREYIAPEAWDGEKPDRRTDIYSLGVVLWELLTGLRLEGSAEVGPGQRPPNPCSVNPAIPPPLGEVVARALAAAPDDRYQTANELGEALAPFGVRDGTSKDTLVTLLRFYFNVDVLRQLLTEDIADARRFLASQQLPHREPVPRGRGLLVAAVTALSVVVAGAAILRLTSHHDLAPKTTMAANPTPLALPPAPVAQPSLTEPALHVPVVRPRVEEGPVMEHAVKARVAGRRSSKELEAIRPEESPKSPPPDELLREAQAQWDRGKDAEALALARKARASGVGAPAYVLRGAILMSESKLTDAERELVEAVRLDPDNAQAKSLLGVAREKIAEGGR
jgi:serine/threonine protein kinase